MSIFKKNVALLLSMIVVMLIMFIPENVSAIEKSATVGDFVVTTTSTSGLNEEDYLAEKHKDGYWTLHIFTSKPVEIKMKDGVKKTNDNILIEKKQGVEKVNVTLNKLNIKAEYCCYPIQAINEYEDKFVVNLILKGTNYLYDDDDGMMGAIEGNNCKLNIKGGKIETNSVIGAANADLYITDTKVKITDEKGSIDVFTYTRKPYYKGNAKLKNVTLNREKVGVQMIHTDGWLTIENSIINGEADSGSWGIVSGKRMKINNSNINVDCSTQGIYVHSGYLSITDSIVTLKTNLDDLSYVSDGDEEYGIETRNLNVTIKRSKINLTSGSKGDGSYGIYGKKVQLIDSIVNVKNYRRGIRAKKQGLTIDSSNVRVESYDKAIMVGPKSGISTKKLSLSGCTMKDGRKKGRYNNKYVVVKTKSGNIAKNVTIKMTKPGKPVLTASNVADTGKIKLSWTTTPLDTKYQVYRAVKKDGKYTKIATVDKVKTTKKAIYVDTKAKAGKTYYYKVRTIAGEKKSAYSKVKSRACK